MVQSGQICCNFEWCLQTIRDFWDRGKQCAIVSMIHRASVERVDVAMIRNAEKVIMRKLGYININFYGCVCSQEKIIIF
jgi:hypothetical protein